MLFKQLITNKELKIIHNDFSPSYLPWDLRTIIDLNLTQDDVQKLEVDIAVVIGECIILLIDEGDR